MQVEAGRRQPRMCSMDGADDRRGEWVACGDAYVEEYGRERGERERACMRGTLTWAGGCATR